MLRLIVDNRAEKPMTTAKLSLLNIILVLLLSNAATSAALVQGDDPRYGAGSLTLDTSSGLAWLDLPVSCGYSYLQALAATGPGGSFDGFRFATAQEVVALCASAGIPKPDWYPRNRLQPPANSFAHFFGWSDKLPGWSSRGSWHFGDRVRQRLPLGHWIGFLVSDRCSRLWRRWASRADARIRYRRHRPLDGLWELAR